MDELNQEINIITSSASPNPDAIRTCLRMLNDKLQAISQDLNHASTRGVSDTVDKLAIALEKLQELAVFIRGDYDGRELDELAKENLFHKLRGEFEEVEARSQQGLRELGDLHNQVMGHGNTVNDDYTNEKPNFVDVQNNYNELAITQAKISSIQQSIQTFDLSVRQQEDAVRTLTSRIDSTHNAYVASTFAIHFLTLGIGTVVSSFVTGAPWDPFNLQAELEDAQRARNNACNQRDKILSEISDLRNEEQRLQQQLKDGQQLEAELPLLSDAAAWTESRCVMIQSSYGTLKDTASRLVAQVKGVVGDMDVISQMVYTKKEFALLLLGLCGDALVDSRLVDCVEKVQDELVGGYGSNMPDEVEEAWNELEGKMVLNKARYRVLQ